MFTRDSSGRAILFPIKEESSRLATSFPFSNRAHGKEPTRVGPMLPPTRAPLKLDAIPVGLRRNRVSRQAEAA